MKDYITRQSIKANLYCQDCSAAVLSRLSDVFKNVKIPYTIQLI